MNILYVPETENYLLRFWNIKAEPLFQINSHPKSMGNMSPLNK